MSMKSGQGFPIKTEKHVNSQEQPSEGSSNTSSKPNEKPSLSPLSVKPGDLPNLKRAVVDNLVNIVESSGDTVTELGRQHLVNFLDRNTKGYVGSLGMICRGNACPFISHCPLNDIDATLPVGKKCPVENSMISIWINKHLKTLGIEDPNDPSHSFDMDMLYELAGQELIRWRCSVHLSDEPGLVSNQQVGATQQGEPIFADVINPVLEVMEKAGRNISRIRDALLATREAQSKAGQLASDPTQRAADLRQKALDSINKRKIKDADFKVKE